MADKKKAASSKKKAGPSRRKKMGEDEGPVVSLGQRTRSGARRGRGRR